MKKITTPIQVKDGKAIYDREGIKEAFDNLSDGWYWLSITKKHKPRTTPENAYYWGVVVESFRIILSDINGEEIEGEQAHELLKQKCNPKTLNLGDEQTTVGDSTTNLTTVEFEDYLERCRTWIKDFFNVDVQLPNE